MDQSITGGSQHLQLTTEEEDEISISTMRSVLLEECTRTLKSSLRTAWKMRLVLRFVVMGIKVFHFKFYSCFLMEWLPLFVWFWVLVRIIVLGFKVSPNVTSILGTRPEKTMVLREFLRNMELLAGVDRRRKEWKKTSVSSTL